MRKIILLITILICGIGFPQMPKDGDISFIYSYDEKVFKETGKIIPNKGMLDVRFNEEVIETIEGDASSVFTSSLKNGQLTVAVGVIDNTLNERYTIMYTIDMESKTVKKKERLNALDTYKDSDLELSIIGDKYDNNAVTMQYTWKGKTNKVILPADKKFGFMFKSYISENGYFVACHHNGLDVFSMDKKKFIRLGEFRGGTSYTYDFCFPLNEYVIYFPWQNFTDSKIYLYRYAEEELYATRYQSVLRNKSKIRDSIISNMRNGNIYEQFLPLTRVENIDSMVNANSTKAWRESIKKVIESSDSKKK